MSAPKKLTVRNGGKNCVILRPGSKQPAVLLGTEADQRVPADRRPATVHEFDGEAADALRKSKAFQALAGKSRYGVQVA